MVLYVVCISTSDPSSIFSVLQVLVNSLIVDRHKMTSTFETFFFCLNPSLLLPAEEEAAVSHLLPLHARGTGDDAAIFAI